MPPKTKRTLGAESQGNESQGAGALQVLDEVAHVAIPEVRDDNVDISRNLSMHEEIMNMLHSLRTELREVKNKNDSLEVELNEMKSRNERLERKFCEKELKEQGRASVIGHASEIDVNIRSESSLDEHREEKCSFDQAPPRQIPLIAQGLPHDRPVHLPHIHQPQHSNNAMPPGFIPPAPLPTFPNVAYAVSPPAYIVNRDSIPIFRGETSANNPLKRNQELETWIRAIENMTRPATDEALLRTAKAHCRGNADLIVNGPAFDMFMDWVTFKAALRRKFRGTYSSSDFFKVLNSHKMTPGQAPLDYFTSPEAHIYQGYRDHPESIGNPEQLIRRMFLQAVPNWLRDFLTIKEDEPPSVIAEFAQRIYNTRMGICQYDSNSPQPEPTPIRQQQSRRYVNVTHTEKWCEFHRLSTHNTHECRAANNATACFNCRQQGHRAANCPFPERRHRPTPVDVGYSRGEISSENPSRLSQSPVRETNRPN